MSKSILFLLLFFILCLFPSSSPLSSAETTRQILSCRNYSFNEEYLSLKRPKLGISCYNIFRIVIFGLGAITFLCLLYFNLANSVKYITFNTDLSLYKKRKILTKSPKCIWTYLSFFLLGFLLSDCSPDLLLMFFIQLNPSFGCTIDILLKCSKIITQIISVFLPLFMFSIAITPAACILCLLVIQIWY